MLCAVAQVTGDLSLLRQEFEPDQTQLLTPGRGLGPEQEAEARRLAEAALEAHVVRGPSPPRAQPGGAAPPLRVPHRRSLDRPLGALPHRGAGARRERPQDADLAREPAGGPGAHAGVLPLRRDRRGRVGPGGGAPAAPGRSRGNRVREERRRRRHLAGERVPRLPGRRPQPALQLLLLADQRLGLPLLGPAGPAGLPTAGGQGPRSGRVHPLLQRGDRGPLRRCVRPMDAHRAGGRRDVGRGILRRRRQRRRPAEPAVLPGPPGARPLRRPLVPLRRLGRRGRAGGSAGRRHRHRRQRRTVRAVHRR